MEFFKTRKKIIHIVSIKINYKIYDFQRKNQREKKWRGVNDLNYARKIKKLIALG